MSKLSLYQKEMEQYYKLRRLSPLTLKKYIFNLTVFCNWLGSKEFTVQNCKNFIIFLSDKGWKVNTINSAISTLKILTQLLEESREIEEDFSHKLKVLRQEPFSPNLLTLEEVVAIIDCPRIWGKYHKWIDRRKYDFFFELLGCCGLRRSEALNLRVKDISFGSGTFRILGKGSKVRTIPLPKITRDKLKIWLYNRKASDENFVFEGHKGRRMGVSTFKDELNKRVKILGIKKRVNFHLLRHTWCTEAIKAGIHPDIIMQIMGHSSYQSHRRYTTLTAENCKKDMERHPLNNLKKRRALEDGFAKAVSSNEPLKKRY